MTDMRIGQPVQEAIGDKAEIVGLRASPLMGLVDAIIPAGVQRFFRGFGSAVAEIIDPVQVISDNRMPASVANEFLEVVNNDPARPAVIKPLKPSF